MAVRQRTAKEVMSTLQSDLKSGVNPVMAGMGVLFGGIRKNPSNNTEAEETTVEFANNNNNGVSTMAGNRRSVLQSQANQMGAGVSGARGRDIKAGAAFGANVLGDGLGRISDNRDVQAGMAGFRQQAQGFSNKESNIKRDRALGAIGQQTQGQSRALQASLARSGVRGGAAGKQIKDVAVSGMKMRQEAEENLFLAEEASKKEGNQALFAGATNIGKFDLGMAAKEKNIMMQSGLGFAQMGVSERAAAQQAAATRAAAAAQAAAQCHTGSAEIKMADGTYKLISDIKLGDITEMGGKVITIGQSYASDDFYSVEGETVTGSHTLWDGETFRTVRDLGYGVDLTTPRDTIIYPMATENGCYVTKSGRVNGDLFTEEETESMGWVKDREIG